MESWWLVMAEGELTETEKNFGWFTQANIKGCEGQWVAIVNGKMLGPNKKIEPLLKEAKKKYPNKVPLVVKVPTEEPLVA